MLNKRPFSVPGQLLLPYDSADKTAVDRDFAWVAGQWQSKTGRRVRRRSGRHPSRRDASALTRRRRIQGRLATDPRSGQGAGAPPVRSAARVRRWAARSVARFAGSSTPVQSARPDAAAHHSVDTPAHGRQTSAASTRPTDSIASAGPITMSFPACCPTRHWRRISVRVRSRAVLEVRGFAWKSEDGPKADRRLPNRPTRLSASLRFGASSWSVGSIWDKSGPPNLHFQPQSAASS